MKDILFLTSSTRLSCRDRLAGVYRFAGPRGWRVQIIERDRIAVPLRKAVALANPIGIIAECGHSFPELKTVDLRRYPTVFLCEDQANWKSRGFFVNTDDVATGRLAADELCRLGLASFAFVGYVGGLYWSDARAEAFSERLLERGCPCARFDPENLVAPARRRKELSAFLRNLPKPCGVFAAHDPVAEEVLVAASHAGIKLPEEMAVIGVDDNTDICERTDPTLTSIRVDFEAGGFLAAKLLAERIKSPRTRFRSESIPPLAVVRRQSTRGSGVYDPMVAHALEKIRRDAENGMSVGDVAAVMRCSRRSAELRFLRNVGRTIRDEINSVLMDRAEALLRDRSIPVDSLAERLGWRSRAAFRTAFAKHFGTTPLKWRKSHLP